MRGAIAIGMLWAAVGLAPVGAGEAKDGPGKAPVRALRERPQTGPSGPIREVLEAQQAAWNRGDIAAFLEGYWNSTELTFAGSGGIVRGYDGLLARYRKDYPDKATMGELEFSELEIRDLGSEAALVVGHWHLKRLKGDIGGVFTLVFRRFPIGWRIVHDHTSIQKQTP